MGRKRSNLETVEGVSIWRRAGAGPRVRYRVTYRDPRTGKRKTETVSADRDLTLEFARDVAARQVRSRKGLTDPVRDRWAAEDQRPIEHHLADWLASMKAAGRDSKHYRQLHDYAKAVLLGNEEERRERAGKRGRGHRVSHEPVALKPLGIRRISQIVASKVQEQIGIVKARRSAGTATRYLDAVNVFLNWGVGDHRWERNVCRHLHRFSAQEDRRLTRRAIEADDFRKLIAATEAADAPKAGGLTGLERSRLYRFTVASGFRANEVRGARMQDVQLTPSPGVWTRASISRKNKKRQFVPLPASLVRELFQFQPADPDGKLLRCPSDTARMLRVDLKRAGIPYKTAAGTFDFHAVRHTTATLLISAGVTNIKAIQEHMRHSRASLTTDTYGHLLESDRDATARALPDFSRAKGAEDDRDLRGMGNSLLPGGQAMDSCSGSVSAPGGGGKAGEDSSVGHRSVSRRKGGDNCPVATAPEPAEAQRQEQRRTGMISTPTSAKRTSAQPNNLNIPQETHWSDGESNPDLLNAIQPSSATVARGTALDGSTGYVPPKTAPPEVGAAPALAQRSLSRPAAAARMMVALRGKGDAC